MTAKFGPLTLAVPRELRRGLLTRDGAGRDPDERALLADVALEASEDGSQPATTAAEWARRALRGAGDGEEEQRTIARAALALCRCDAFAASNAARS